MWEIWQLGGKEGAVAGGWFGRGRTKVRGVERLGNALAAHGAEDAFCQWSGRLLLRDYETEIETSSTSRLRLKCGQRVQASWREAFGSVPRFRNQVCGRRKGWIAGRRRLRTCHLSHLPTCPIERAQREDVSDRGEHVHTRMNTARRRDLDFNNRMEGPRKSRQKRNLAGAEPASFGGMRNGVRIVFGRRWPGCCGGGVQEEIRGKPVLEVENNLAGASESSSVTSRQLPRTNYPAAQARACKEKATLHSGKGGGTGSGGSLRFSSASPSAY